MVSSTAMSAFLIAATILFSMTVLVQSTSAIVYVQYITGLSASNTCGTATLNCTVNSATSYTCFQLITGTHYYYHPLPSSPPVIQSFISLQSSCGIYPASQNLPFDAEGLTLTYYPSNSSTTLSCIQVYLYQHTSVRVDPDQVTGNNIVTYAYNTNASLVPSCPLNPVSSSSSTGAAAPLPTAVVYFQYATQLSGANTCGIAALECTIINATTSSYSCFQLINGTHYYYTSLTAVPVIQPFVSLQSSCGVYPADQQLPIDSEGVTLTYYQSNSSTSLSCIQVYVYASGDGLIHVDPDQVTGNNIGSYSYSTNASLVPSCPLNPVAAPLPTTVVYFQYATQLTGANTCGTATLNCSITNATANSYSCFQLISGTHYYYTPSLASVPVIQPFVSLQSSCGAYPADQQFPIDSEGLTLSYYQSGYSTSLSCIQVYLYASGDGLIHADPDQVSGNNVASYAYSTNASAVPSCPLNAPSPSAPASGSICIFIQGVTGSDPWAAAGTSAWVAILQASVTYSLSQSRNVFTDAGLGTYLTLNSIINGSISIYSPFLSASSGTQAVVTAPILQLSNGTVSGVSNAIYIGATAAALDTNGLSLILASGIEFPGQSATQVSNVINIYFAIDPSTGRRYPRIRGFGPSSATASAFITDVLDVSFTFAASAAINSPSACQNAFAASNLAVPAAVNPPNQPAITAIIQLNYSITDSTTYVVRVTLIMAVVQSGAADVYGVTHAVVTVTSGTRYYGYGTPANNFTSSTETSTVNTGACLTANQYLYADPSQYPYIDASGIQYSVRPTQALLGLPATAASHKSTAFTVFADPTTSSLNEQPSATTAVPTQSTISYAIIG